MKKIFAFLLILLISTQSLKPNIPFLQQPSNEVIEILKQMSLPEKVGQLFTIGASSMCNQDEIEMISKLILDYHIGGLIFSKGYLDKQIELIYNYQTLAKYPLLISQDCEWGTKMRLLDENIIKYPHNMTLGAIQDETLLYKIGLEIGKQCKQAGVSVNFAPVIDINSNPNNPIINDRSFGENKHNVARKGGTFMIGMQDANVIACAKHFPGHGDTTIDSHLDLPTIHKTFEELRNQELYPFSSLINTGLQAMMVAHLLVPSIDPINPSSISPTTIKDLLKYQMKFNGLIFSDSIDMKGILKNNTIDEIAILAAIAGIDNIILCDHDKTNNQTYLDTLMSIKQIISAVKRGIISEQEVNEKVFKILMAKQWLGLFENRFPEIIESSKDTSLKQKLFDEAVTLLKDENQLIYKNKINLKNTATIVIGESPCSNYILQTCSLPTFKLDNNLPEIINKIKPYKQVIVTVHGMTKNNEDNFGINIDTFKLLEKLKQKNKHAVIILFGSPYSSRLFEEQNNLLVAYEDEIEAANSSFDILIGRKLPKGKLPVSASYIFYEGSGLISDTKNISTAPSLLKATNSANR